MHARYCLREAQSTHVLRYLYPRPLRFALSPRFGLMFCSQQVSAPMPASCPPPPHLSVMIYLSARFECSVCAGRVVSNHSLGDYITIVSVRRPRAPLFGGSVCRYSAVRGARGHQSNGVHRPGSAGPQTATQRIRLTGS